MNPAIFISKRLSKLNSSNRTAQLIRVSLIAVALSSLIMVASITIVKGFQQAIKEKVYGYVGHIRIQALEKNQSFEQSPIELSASQLNSIKATAGVKHIQTYATKAGIIKSKTEIQGVILKGVTSDFNWEMVSNSLQSGINPRVKELKNDEVYISKSIAGKLDLQAGSKMLMYFIQEPPRVRKFIVKGIYETGLGDFDDLYIFGSINQIRKLNNWDSTQVGGYEIEVNQPDDADIINESILGLTGPEIDSKSTKELYPQLFDWLKLQDINGVIIIVLMLIIALMNMGSAFLIITLEKTRTIALLSAIGADKSHLRNIFILIGVRLSLKGLLLGGGLGLLLCYLQYEFGFIKLDQESYFIDKVPVYFDWVLIIGTLSLSWLICWLMLLIPSRVISKIKPAKALRFT